MRCRAAHWRDQVDTHRLAELLIVVTSVKGVCQQFDGVKIHRLEVLDHLGQRIAIFIGSGFGNRTGDELYTVLRVARFAELNLVPRPFVAIVRRVGIRWVLHRAIARMLSDRHSVADHFALFFKNSDHIFVRAHRRDFRMVGITLDQKKQIFRSLLATFLMGEAILRTLTKLAFPAFTTTIPKRHVQLIVRDSVRTEPPDQTCRHQRPPTKSIPASPSAL